MRQTKTIFKWLVELDQILRGKLTDPAQVEGAEIKIPVWGIGAVVLLLGATYGVCMGVFALARGFENEQYNQALLQVFASMCKVPLLYLLTLVVTFPSLYVFNALVGSQLKLVAVLKLLGVSLAVNLAVLASLGPIVAFFSVCTPNYAFVVLLNVVVLALAGTLGLAFLVQTLNRLTLVMQESGAVATDRGDAREPRVVEASLIPDPLPTHGEEGVPSSGASETIGVVPDFESGPGSEWSGREDEHREIGPLDSWGARGVVRNVKNVFACWIILFGVVGAQMGWVLRPFIGAPGKPFQWFRARESNFFEAVMNVLDNLFSGV